MTRFAAVLATSLFGACLVTKPIVPAAGKVALAVDLPAHLTLHNVPSGELTIEGSVDAKNGPLTVALFADDKEVMGLVAEGKETFTLRWTLPLGEDAIVHRLAVRATSALGGEALGAVTAAVVVDTAITVACTPDKATIGATITCQALNDGAPLAVVWQATGVTIAESGAVTSSVAVAGEVTATYRSDVHSATIAFFDPPPAATISAPSIVTAGKAGTSASVASAPDMSYAWTISNGSIDVNGVAAAAFTPGPVGIATLAVTITNGAGATTTASKTLTIVAPPTTPIVTGPAAFSLGSGNIIASITNPVGGVVYTWQVSGGTLLGGQGSTSAIIAPSDVGTVIATATTTNAAGDTAS
ncbi:MAG: hypothetical protein IT381_02665, partial [Deltaproteobacteria bacterium]|nr:hypothetical protein [Deltaproteobacteria bacterium]